RLQPDQPAPAPAGPASASPFSVPSPGPPAAAVPLLDRSVRYNELFQSVYAATGKLTGDRAQFFFEHVTFPLLIDARQTAAAVKLWNAVAESDPAAVRRWSMLAFDDLKSLEDDIRRA